MGKIQILSEQIANRIAAGEVVERPASIVKELVENSLDAKASAITVSILDGGIREIRVTDNGEGIAEEDMPLTILKHATSKIYKLQDLDRIYSMGFRGEALASIAAVSMLSIKSRVHASDAGTKLCAKGGKIEYIRQAGLPEGTSVIVENLFYNTPARLKFLKKPGSEAAAISDIVSRLILARPDISLRYTANGKGIYHSPGSGELLDAICAVNGQQMRSQLIPVDYRINQIHVFGYIGAPDITYKTQKNGSLFINQRYIRSEVIQAAILRAYGERILRGSFPFYTLHLNMDLSDVDVNVHPNKLTVHFSDENAVEYAVINAVSDALAGQYSPVVPQFQSSERNVSYEQLKMTEDLPKPEEVPSLRFGTDFSAQKEPSSQEDWKMPSDSELEDGIEEIMRLTAEYQKKGPAEINAPSEISFVDPPKDFSLALERADQKHTAAAAPSQPTLISNLPEVQILGVAFSTYIIAEAGENLYFIDQHAAHERKIYDALMQAMEKRAVSQRLLIPEVYRLTHEEQVCLEENLEILAQMGFELQLSAPLVCEIHAVPQILGEAKAAATLEDVLGSLAGGAIPETVRKDRIAKGACKRAIKAGQPMIESDIKNLVQYFLQSGKIPNCPHGRPIAVCIPKKELEISFKRRV